jgi:hypothetical protein
MAASCRVARATGNGYRSIVDQRKRADQEFGAS